MIVISRLLLVILVIFVLWVAFQQDLNLSPYTPQQTFRSLEPALFFHILLHLFVPFLMTVLLYASRIFEIESKRKLIAICAVVVLFLSLLTEAVQGHVGRNVELMDLVLDLVAICAGAFILSRAFTRSAKILR